MDDLNLTVIVLTRNEARHLERCLASVKDFASRVLVVDSGSTDDTVEIAERAGAKVMHNPWLNHATQFNFALDQLPEDARWVFRLDADEVVTPQLSAEIIEVIRLMPPSSEAGPSRSRQTLPGSLLWPAFTTAANAFS